MRKQSQDNCNDIVKYILSPIKENETEYDIIDEILNTQDEFIRMKHT